MIENDKLSEIVKRAAQDSEYRKQLVSNPNKVVEQHLGKLPDNLEIKIVENTQNVIHLVLPPDTTALSDADLDGVTGGAGGPKDPTKPTFTPDEVI